VPRWTVTRRARGATYVIDVTNSGTPGARARLVVDGVPIQGQLVRYAAPGSTVHVVATL
jgi:cellobiose phosphorylase